MGEVANKKAMAAREQQPTSWEVIYEGMVRQHVPSDPKAELALLTVCWMTEDAALINKLEPNDFHDLTHRYIHSEFKLLIESGEPFGDAVAVIRWFGTDAVQQRARQAINEQRPKQLLAAMLRSFEENFFGTAHKDYYREVVRRDRLRRAVFYAALKIIETNIENNKEPWKTVQKMGDWNNQLFEMCYREFPAEMDRS